MHPTEVLDHWRWRCCIFYHSGLAVVDNAWLCWLHGSSGIPKNALTFSFKVIKVLPPRISNNMEPQDIQKDVFRGNSRFESKPARCIAGDKWAEQSDHELLTRPSQYFGISEFLPIFRTYGSTFVRENVRLRSQLNQKVEVPAIFFGKCLDLNVNMTFKNKYIYI